MFIIPFRGVDGILFDVEVNVAIRNLGGDYKKINRVHDVESEYFVFNQVRKDVPRLSLHELKGRNGVQAITIIGESAFLKNHPQIDLMQTTRRDIRRLIHENFKEVDDQTDVFPSLGLSLYFEGADKNQKPAAILVASRYYMSIL